LENNFINSAIVQKIKYIDIFEDKVYIELTNFDSDYFSFNKAKKIIKESKTEIIKYSCADNEKAVSFVNSLSFYASRMDSDVSDRYLKFKTNTRTKE
jgi:hypothetical protein